MDKNGCFGCKKANPLYRWTLDNLMIVECPIHGELPERMICSDFMSYEKANTVLLKLEYSWTEENIDAIEEYLKTGDVKMPREDILAAIKESIDSAVEDICETAGFKDKVRYEGGE